MKEQEELLIKFKEYLKFNNKINKECCDDVLNDWIKSMLMIKSSITTKCCYEALRLLQHFLLEDSYEKDYIVKVNPIFGDLHQIRTSGFEARFLFNSKLFKTYIESYEATELEYEQNFGKRRYSSYDSFRQVRTRHFKK